MSTKKTETKPTWPASRAHARVFLNKPFVRSARKEGLSDEDLCKAVRELEDGKGDDLGGNVWKKRVDKNRARAIVATKPGAFWVFADLFSKNDRENIDPDELAAFKKLAAIYGQAGTTGMDKLVAGGTIKEICNERQKGFEEGNDDEAPRRAG
jgi:hypothetical protein